MTLSKTQIEKKVEEANDWLQNHHKNHHSYSRQEQRRNYLVGKLCTMDEMGLKAIKI